MGAANPMKQFMILTNLERGRGAKLKGEEHIAPPLFTSFFSQVLISSSHRIKSLASAHLSERLPFQYCSRLNCYHQIREGLV